MMQVKETVNQWLSNKSSMTTFFFQSAYWYNYNTIHNIVIQLYNSLQFAQIIKYY